MSTQNATSKGSRLLKASIALVSVAMLLAGCAPGTPAPTATESSSSGTGTVEPGFEISTTLSSDPITLTIADETGFPLTDILAEEFSRQFPNVTFNVTRDTFQNLTANAPKLLASDTPPDLIRLPTIGDTVRDGLIANLDPWFEAYGWDKWSPSQLAPLRVNADGVRGSGNLYQLGLGYSVTGIYMNKSHAATIGLKEEPKTLAEFEDALAKAKAAGILPIMAGDKDGVVNFVVQAAMNMYADPQEMMDWILNVPGATYETPGNITGADLIRKWADAGYFPSDINAIDYPSFVTRFQEGEGLFTFNGNWAAADTQAKMGDNVSFFLVPTVESGGRHVAMGAANSFSVASGSKNLNEIIFFLNWIHTDPVARQIVTDITGAAPGGDPAQEQPVVEPGSLIEQALAMSAQIGAENGQVDFMANATAGIYAGAIIPESQLLVSSQITGEQFVVAVQKFYAEELANK